MTPARRIFDGLRAPLVALRKGRRIPAGERYRKLVLWQLVATLAVMAIVTPNLLTGLDLAARNPHSDYEIRGARLVIVHRGDHEKHGKRKRSTDKLTNEDDGDEEEPATGGHIKVAGAQFFDDHAPGLLPLWIALVSLYGAWLLVEWIVAALSHEYADAISDALCTDLGLPCKPSKLDRPPKLRVDFRWMWKRMWRQALAAIVFASGAPLFLLARLVPRVGTYLSAVVVTAWGLYWLLVTTAAKSDLAWQETALRPPWFLRGWTLLTTRVPGFRWWLFRSYGRLWSRVTTKMHGAAELLEEAPWETVGLSVVRIVSNLPIVAMLVKPMLPVAASLVYVRRREKMGAPKGA